MGKTAFVSYVKPGDRVQVLSLAADDKLISVQVGAATKITRDDVTLRMDSGELVLFEIAEPGSLIRTNPAPLLGWPDSDNARCDPTTIWTLFCDIED